MIKVSSFLTPQQKTQRIIDKVCSLGKPDTNRPGGMTEYKNKLRSLGMSQINIKKVTFGEYKGLFRIIGNVDFIGEFDLYI